MKISDLNKVEKLKDELNNAIGRHKAAKSLIPPGYGSFGFSRRAKIFLGGDEYGNGIVSTMTIDIKDSPELMRHCQKLVDDAWGRVVSLRADLRLLGVELESK